MRSKGTTIRQRLMSVILITSSAVLTISCITYFTYEFLSFRQSTVRQLKTMGEIIAANSTAALAFENKDDAKEILDALKADKHIIAACLYDKDGRIFSVYPDNQSSQNIPMVPMNDGYRFLNGHLLGNQPVLEGNTRLGTLYICTDMDAMYARLRLYGLVVCIIILVSYLLAYLLSLRLRETILKPVFSLVETTQTISVNNDYTVRARKYGEDELGSLTDAFNNMLARIEVQNEAIKSFNQLLELKVTERTTQLEEANNILREQKEIVETIINSSVDTIAVLNRNFEYLIVNNQIEQRYKLEKEFILGKSLLELFPEVKESGMYNGLVKALKGEAIHHTNYKSPILKRHFENFYIPLKDKTDNVYGILVIGHDITEISEANEKLQRVNTELVKSNLELEQFAYIASHDLQEPLRKILMFSQLVENNLHNPETAKKYFAKINSSASRMADLIKDVLNYSRLSKMEEEYIPVDLTAVLENVQSDLELIVSEKHAKIIGTQLPVITGIPFQLNQLFLNLLSNSLKFCDKKPVILISASILTVEELNNHNGNNVNILTTEIDPATNYAELVFKDNGIGFETEYAQQVFTIFKRLHSNQNYPGTGIGLALVKKIVENHRGFITVKSIPGEGSSFYIYLPVNRNP